MGEAKRRQDAGAPPRMKLTCYETTTDPIRLRPAPPDRDWMDATNVQYAYRCLPLAIANAHGWEILCPAAFEAEWTGSNQIDGVRITPLDRFGDYPPVMSHFGEGVLTFHVGGLFRTDPGVNLWVGGPPNRPKHGIAALTGIVETDWTYASFTMNWKFTAPGVRVRFDRDEPFCFIFPLRRGALDEVQPEIQSISRADRETYDGYARWREQRSKFIDQLQVPGTEANEARWERSYFRGAHADGTPGGVPDHQTRVRVHPFKRV
jgi:hypothetical protein